MFISIKVLYLSIFKQQDMKLEILDNRNHKEGLEIYEDGYGKWYAFNPETGKIMACKFKWQAQELVDNPTKDMLVEDDLELFMDEEDLQDYRSYD